MLSAGARFSGKRFVLRAISNAGNAGDDAQRGISDRSGAVARLGLIASRKAARRAVDRNRAKRLAREVFRLSRPSLPACDVVLQLRENLRGSANHEVRAELTRLLRELQRRAGSVSATASE